METAASPVAPDTGTQVGTPLRELILPPAPLDRFTLRRFSLDEYHRLIEIGFLTNKDKLELLEGLLVMRPEISPLRAHTSSKLHRVFSPLYRRENTMLRIRGPISIHVSDSEPEPDLAIYAGSEADHWERHPHPYEVNLIAEIDDSSSGRNRSRKGRIYAHAGILEYWIVNLPDRSLELYRDPHTPLSGDAVYQTKLTLRHGDSIAPLAFPDFEVAVSDFL